MAGLAALLIISAACAGYLFCDKCVRYKYIFPREDGQRFYIRTVTYGFPIVLFALLINEVLFWFPAHEYTPALITLSKEEGALYAGVFAPLYGWLGASIYNLAIGESGRFEHFQKALMADDFDSILWRSMSTFQPMAVSLENRKVYVGLVADGFEPSTSPNSYLTIVPLLSGHRNPDTLQMEITAVYEPVLELLENLPYGEEDYQPEELEAYYIAIPRTKIVSLNLFNDHLYQQVSSQYLEIDPANGADVDAVAATANQTPSNTKSKTTFCWGKIATFIRKIF